MVAWKYIFNSICVNFLYALLYLQVNQSYSNQNYHQQQQHLQPPQQQQQQNQQQQQQQHQHHQYGFSDQLQGSQRHTPPPSFSQSQQSSQMSMFSQLPLSQFSSDAYVSYPKTSYNSGPPNTGALHSGPLRMPDGHGPIDESSNTSFATKLGQYTLFGDRSHANQTMDTPEKQYHNMTSRPKAPTTKESSGEDANDADEDVEDTDDPPDDGGCDAAGDRDTA